MIKILHTADVHLDSPLKSLVLKDVDLQSTVKTATRSAFIKIVDTALKPFLKRSLFALTVPQFEFA